MIDFIARKRIREMRELNNYRNTLPDITVHQFTELEIQNKVDWAELHIQVILIF